MPHAQQPAQIDDAALKKAPAGDNWLTYGLDQSETRFSPLADINAANVKELGLSWAYDVGPGGGGQEATPIVANGVIYGITNWSIVFAVDARTGKEKWRWDPWVNQAATRPGDLLRRRQPRPGDLQGDDLRADHRRTPAGARRRNRQGGVGSARRATRRTTTRSPWRRASPRAR